MSKISIKTDFKDGDKLPASDLNNNFKVIQEGVNANETNLESVIVDAEARLQKELEQITADRGWDWGGSSPDRATFYKNGTEQVNSKDIVNGQLLVDTETGEIFLDNDGKRISAGSGSVVQVGGEEPTNTATKIWFPDDTIDTKASEITNSMDGNETDLAPSVNAVKSYINNSKNVMTIRNTSYQNGVSNNTTINMDSSISVGNKLTLESNGIKIGSGISKVLISGCIAIQYSSINGEYGATIAKNGTQISSIRVGMYKSGSAVTNMHISPVLIEVEENDILTLVKLGNNSCDIRSECYLTVEVVEEVSE